MLNALDCISLTFLKILYSNTFKVKLQFFSHQKKKKTFQVLPTFNLVKIILSPQVKHNAFCHYAQVPHFVSLLTFHFSRSSKKKLSVQSSHRPHGSLFIR